MMSRAAGLSADSPECKGPLLHSVAYYVRPDARVSAHLSFPPTNRISPQELTRWMCDGSILAWAENLSTRAGEHRRAEGGEVFSSGDPNDGDYSRYATGRTPPKERSVQRNGRETRKTARSPRRICVSRQGSIGKLYEKKMSFLGIGEAVLPATQELFQS